MLGLGNSLTGGGVSTEFLPTDIAGISLWLRNGVGVAVGQWDDSSGNNNHATQGTSGDQAAVVDGGLDFEGSEEDHYDLTSGITIPTADGSAGGHYIGIVIKIESDNLNTFLSSAVSEFMEFQSNWHFENHKQWNQYL